jgi:glycosyltransferase involved in cell wall biosynthesis
MIQVLHLMSQTPDLFNERTSQSIARAAGSEFAVTKRTIGRGGAYRDAAQAAMALRFGRGILFDVVHAWDVPSVLGACASPSPIIYSPSVPPNGSSVWLKPAMVYRNGTVIANSSSLQRSLIKCGVPAYRCDVIPPVVDFARIPGSRNDVLRAALGFSAGDRVVLAPGESTRATRHLLALHTTSILRVLDARFRFLIWGRGTGAGAIARMARAYIDPQVLVIAERRLGHPIAFEELLGAADVALVTASSIAPSLPIALCMAAGLPIVAINNAMTREILEAGQTASVVPQPSPRLLAKAVLELVEDKGRAAKLRCGARIEAAQRFDPRQTVGRFLSLYRRAAGVGAKGLPMPLDFTSVHVSKVSPLASG